MENKTIPPMYPTEFVERELGIRTDCYNHSCPFRVNDTSSASRCECTACPNRCIDVFGEHLTISEAAQKYGIKPCTIRARIEHGWAPERAVSIRPGETVKLDDIIGGAQ